MAGGLKAKRFGEMFEAMFAANCVRMGCVTTRMPDGCQQVGPHRLIRVRTPWDWILTHEGKTALIDTKTINEKRFPTSLVVAHQVNEMRLHERAGAVAGYVIWLRPIDQIFFASALTLDNMVPRGSIGVGPGTLELGNSLSFDISRIFKPA